MALDKLKILIERPGGKLQFSDNDPSSCIEAMFNPNHITFSRSVQWESQKAAKRDTPELQFTGSDPSTLSIDLFFDTYDTPTLAKKSVYEHTQRLLHLTTVETHGDKHRPPVCQLSWGSAGVFFQGVLQQMEQNITMFMPDGTPVRSTVKCTFKQWRTNQKDSRHQMLESSDIAKLWLVKHNDTLASIAAREYGDPRLWRHIAKANDIDDPTNIAAGTRLALPPLRAH